MVDEDKDVFSICPKLDTDDEKMEKRIQRTLDVIEENINTLYSVEFDLNYFADYTCDENLKVADYYVNLAIEHMKAFYHKNNTSKK